MSSASSPAYACPPFSEPDLTSHVSRFTFHATLNPQYATRNPMIFPHYFHFFGHQLDPHPVMELIAYTGGFQLYLWLRRRARRAQPSATTPSRSLAASPKGRSSYHDNPIVPFEQNMWLIVAAIFGAVIGSKILA